MAKIKVIKLIGEVLEVTDDSILINVMLNRRTKDNQVRRFPIGPFKGLELEKNHYVNIVTTTQPGSVLFQYSRNYGNHKKLFMPIDHFKGIENTSFFKGNKEA